MPEKNDAHEAYRSLNYDDGRKKTYVLSSSHGTEKLVRLMRFLLGSELRHVKSIVVKY